MSYELTKYEKYKGHLYDLWDAFSEMIVEDKEELHITIGDYKIDIVKNKNKLE